MWIICWLLKCPFYIKTPKTFSKWWVRWLTWWKKVVYIKLFCNKKHKSKRKMAAKRQKRQLILHLQESIKCLTSFTFFNYLLFDMQAEHSVINISGDNGVSSHWSISYIHYPPFTRPNGFFFDGGIVEGITPRHFILGWDF